jgi:hypothetical protein
MKNKIYFSCKHASLELNESNLNSVMLLETDSVVNYIYSLMSSNCLGKLLFTKLFLQCIRVQRSEDKAGEVEDGEGIDGVSESGEVRVVMMKVVRMEVVRVEFVWRRG